MAMTVLTTAAINVVVMCADKTNTGGRSGVWTHPPPSSGAAWSAGLAVKEVP